METTRRTEELPLKDMGKMVAPLLHRKLILRVKGMGEQAEGDWQYLLKIAVHYGAKDWEIVEKVSGLGERIITKHSSLLQSHGVE